MRAFILTLVLLAAALNGPAMAQQAVPFRSVPNAKAPRSNCAQTWLGCTARRLR